MNNNIVMSGSMWRFLVIMLICSLSFIWAEDKQTSSAVANKAYKDNNKYVTIITQPQLRGGTRMRKSEELSKNIEQNTDGFLLIKSYNQHTHSKILLLLYKPPYSHQVFAIPFHTQLAI